MLGERKVSNQILIFMITGLHHCVLLAPDMTSALSLYSSLLGRDPDWVGAPGEDGTTTALFVLDHTALEILAPVDDGEGANKLRDLIAADGPGLKSIAFSVENMPRWHTLLIRRGLEPSDVSERNVAGTEGFARRRWTSCRIPDAKTAGIKTFFVEEKNKILAQPVGDDCVHTLDHFVIATPDTQRTLAHYGARLGLDLRLDRTYPDWGAHFLFFKTGGLIFEIVQRLKEDNDPSAADQIYGLTWTVRDLPAARKRLVDLGLNVSEIRTGRKPGSEVFTVRDGTLGVPTLFISHTPR